MQATTMSTQYGLRKQTKRPSSKTSHKTSTDKEIASSHLVQSTKVFQEIQNRVSRYNSVVEMHKDDSTYGESEYPTPKVSAKNPFNRQNSICTADQIGAHLSQMPSMKFFQTPEKNLANTISEMVLRDFDPSQIPQSLQSLNVTDETKKGAKVPSSYQVQNKTSITLSQNRRNSHTQSIKKASPVKRSEFKENCSELISGIELYSKTKTIEQSPAKLQPYASPSKTLYHQQEEPCLILQPVLISNKQEFQYSLPSTPQELQAIKSRPERPNRNPENDYFSECGNDVIAVAMYENLMRLQEQSPATPQKISALNLPKQPVPEEKSSQRRKRSQRVTVTQTAAVSTSVQSKTQSQKSESRTRAASGSAQASVTRKPKQAIVNEPKLASSKEQKQSSAKKIHSCSVASFGTNAAHKFSIISIGVRKDHQSPIKSRHSQEHISMSKESPQKSRVERQAVKVHHSVMHSPSKKIIQQQSTEIICSVEVKPILKEETPKAIARKKDADAKKIQQAFKRHLILRGINWRKSVKQNLMAVVRAWRTRRALNCLGAEVQSYVNCEAPGKKQRLRQEFHLLFDIVLQEKLYLEKNQRQLQSLQNMHAQNQSMSSLYGQESQLTLLSNQSNVSIPQTTPKKLPVKTFETTAKERDEQEKILSFKEKALAQVRDRNVSQLSNQCSSIMMHSSETLNESLKPREPRAILQSQVQPPVRPEQMSDMSYSVTSPNKSKFQTNILIQVVSPQPQKKNAEPPVIKEKKPNLSSYISVPAKKKESESEVVLEQVLSASKSSDGKAGPYKSKISSVKHRVDCWNRSNSKGDTTPTRPLIQPVDDVKLPQPFNNQHCEGKIGLTEFIQVPARKRNNQTPKETKTQQMPLQMPQAKMIVAETSHKVKVPQTATKKQPTPEVTLKPEIIKPLITKPVENSKIVPVKAFGRRASEQMLKTPLKEATPVSTKSATNIPVRTQSAVQASARNASANRRPLVEKQKPHPYIATLSEMNILMSVLADYNTTQKGTAKTDMRVKGKVVAQAEKDFKKLIRQLEDQFDTQKTALLGQD